MTKRRLFALTTLLALLVSLSIMPGTLAEEPEPGQPVGGTADHGHADDGSLRRSPEGKWYMPTDAMPPERQSTTTSPADTGGPDEFGYTWDDSVAFNWIDATTGTDTGLTGDDRYTNTIDIGFDFKFYENTHSQLYISTNGLVTFGEGAYHYANQRIPNYSQPNEFVTPFWDDLCVNYGDYNTGSIYYLRGGSAPNRYFVVEWYEISRLGSTDLLTFEVILHENGDIVMQYLSLSGTLNSASVGIEDGVGADGLQYLYNTSGLGNNDVVRFYRPDPIARLKTWPLHYGGLTRAGGTVSFEIPIRNTGDLGADTYDLTVSSPWAANLYDIGGVPLTDTDGDSTIDTGPVPQGVTITVVVEVATPSAANLGDDNTAQVTARSSLDVGKSKTVSLKTAVPAPFAHAYRDIDDGAMSLYLAHPNALGQVKATSNWHNGYEVAMAEMPTSFVYAWSKYRYTGGVSIYELEYTLLDHYGNTTRAVSKLADHSGTTYHTYDRSPAVAVAPNGTIGVAWYRYLSNPSNGYWNYNIYYALLDASGAVIVPPTNLTQETAWGYG